MKVLEVLENNSIGIGLVICLLVALIDENAIKRVKEKKMYLFCAYGAIVLYFLDILAKCIKAL